MSGYRVFGGGSGGGAAGFTDDFSLNIKADDSNATPTDADTYAMTLDLADTVAAQTETAELKFPSGVWGDSSGTPTDAQGFSVQVWLANSSGTGVSNPTNADGENDGSNATVQTAVAGPTTETLTSDVGTNVGSWSFTSVTYQGWFTLATTLATSTAEVIARSSTAAFGDIVMITLSATDDSVDHSSGDFTYDLYAAGVDTLAKLQSLQIVHQTTDAAAGVTPAVVQADAGLVEIDGVF